MLGLHMTQKMGPATGIVSVLVVLGVILAVTGIAPELGFLAIAAGIGLGILYGLLGVVGIAHRNHMF